MMRPLLGIVFPPSDKSGLTRPLGLNCLVTELHPDWDPAQHAMSCPVREHVILSYVMLLETRKKLS